MNKKILFLFPLLMGCCAAQSIEGIWLGSIEAGGTTLRLAFHVAKNDAGAFTTKWDSLDQGANGLATRKTTFADGKLHVEVSPSITLDATLSADGQQFSGTFTQGSPIPITLQKVDKIDPPKRPQEPKPPFPYDSEEVMYAGGGSNRVTLAGTLTKPRGAGPFPAALLITGSGPQDRDETSLGHKPFWVIADYLTRRGIAVLRVDDRGTGKSGGISQRTTMSEMADDVLKGVALLKGRKEIDPRHIGVIGHSEGGVVGPLAASRSSDISFVVMLGGPGVPGAAVMTLQGELILRAEGAADDVIQRNRQTQQFMFGVLLNNREAGVTELLKKLSDGIPQLLAGVPEEQRQAGEQRLRMEFNRVLTAELRTFLTHDPQPVLQKLKMPVLALNGSSDTQVNPKQNLPAIVNALTMGGNSDFAVMELPGLNHFFQHCKTCTPSEIGELEETFAPEALEIVAQWLARHTQSH